MLLKETTTAVYAQNTVVDSGLSTLRILSVYTDGGFEDDDIELTLYR